MAEEWLVEKKGCGFTQPLRALEVEKPMVPDIAIAKTAGDVWAVATEYVDLGGYEEEDG